MSSPGVARSGMVHSGKIYETDGEQAIAIHDPQDARLLAPVGHPPSVRLFDVSATGGDFSGLAEGRSASFEFPFAYLNSSTIIGPQTETMPCHISEEISFKPCLAVVVGAAATLLTPEESDQAVLGLTLVNVFYAADVDRMERIKGVPPSRSHDLGFAVGPVVTTPDELEPTLLEDPNARRYKISISAQVNDEEVFRFDTSDLPFTPGEAISYASSSCAIRSGDLICLSLGLPELEIPLRSGDTVRLVSDRLGSLINRVG
jgi:2-keto-4-pentenoate hydratase/2-oxohepta-3-ene-1,7-dioic acid hydratase in catechol pathway